ncbi:MAG: uracil-DNA glycosylase [Candidatus Xenobia bacterium]
MAFPNCYACEHFHITHEQKAPRACRMFNFKGKELPALAVFNVTGKHCPYYRPKGDAASPSPVTAPAAPQPRFQGNATDGWIA